MRRSKTSPTKRSLWLARTSERPSCTTSHRTGWRSSVQSSADFPDDEQAAALWDHVTGLAQFPGFAELKTSLRERLQLPSFGVDAGNTGKVEDWHSGSRRTKR